MVAPNNIIPITRPIDRLSVHGHFELPVATLRKLGNSKSKELKDIQLVTAFEVKGGYNLMSCLLLLLPSKTKDEKNREVHLDIAQDWTPSEPPKELHKQFVPGDIEKIKVALAELSVIKSKLTYGGVWVFSSKEIETVVSLPFPVTVPLGVDLTLGRGLRLTNRDGTRSVTIDKDVDDTTTVVASMDSETRQQPSLLEDVLVSCKTLVDTLVKSVKV